MYICQHRELGVQKDNHCIPYHFVERFRCKRIDVHHIGGSDGSSIPPLGCSYSLEDPYILAVVDEDGGILILDTSKEGPLGVKQDWLAHHNAVFDVQWVPRQRHQLITASGDQTLQLWDVEREESLATFKGHTSSVRAVKFYQQNSNVFASGARDGNIMIWDKRINKKDGFFPPVNIIRNAHKLNTAPSSASKKKGLGVAVDAHQSVTAVVFQDENTLLSGASVDGSIRVWDMRKNYSVLKSDAAPKHVFPYSGSSSRKYGISSLCFDASGTRLFSNCLDNVIYEYDCASYNTKPVSFLMGHRNGDFFVKSCISPCGKFLLSGSSDDQAYIWNLRNPWEACVLVGHLGEVSSVAWNPRDFTEIVTLSDDTTARVWRMQHPDNKWCDEPTDMAGTCSFRKLDLTSAVLGLKHLSSILPFVKPVPPTPVKGATLPPSPVKLSNSVRRTLLNLMSSPRSNVVVKDPTKLVSPSLTKWFGKALPQKDGHQPAFSISPMKRTPRKLVVTPKKLSTVSPHSSVQTELKPSHSFKRKLDLSFESPVHPVGPSSLDKRRRVEDFGDENLSCSSLVPTKMSSSKTRILQPASGLYSNGDCNEPDNRLHNLEEYDDEFVADECSTPKTPIQKLTRREHFQSPTVNLPNYVFDPQPRTPVGKLSANSKPNWLTVMRNDKQSSEIAQESEGNPATNNLIEASVCVTPKSNSPANQEVKETKGSKSVPRKKLIPRTPKQTKSILQYFSPKSASAHK